MKNTTFNPLDVNAIAKLAKIPVSDAEKKELGEGFNKVLNVLDELKDVNTKNVEPTHQVTNLENVLREDEIDTTRILPVSTEHTHNGYFVVKRILDET